MASSRAFQTLSSSVGLYPGTDSISVAEFGLGEDVLFEALVVDSDGSPLAGQPGVELHWTLCLSLAEVIRASGLGFGSTLEDNCDEGGDDLFHLETEGLPPNSARLPGTAILTLLQELMEGGGMMLPPDQQIDPMLTEGLFLIVSEVGVALRVRLDGALGGGR